MTSQNEICLARVRRKLPTRLSAPLAKTCRKEDPRMISSNVKNVRSRIRTALGASPLFPLRQLQVEYFDDRIVLAGRVDNFYQKQMAQEVARSVSPEIELINSVEVGLS
ncbi:BON domain-containing protein [Blastopirellula marina]|uniref:BON domain-containing protein n=1 Tax=Blastopirellula marina DSM 3645 TaxID=314230 RepID=A3ZNS9_9BACT|nr:BON domain-containing protein [Blastopirellula marina]EAQ81977.1 hypothetical protein DSM3645_17535 [Blastopirellula marina DSM 3645]